MVSDMDRMLSDFIGNFSGCLGTFCSFVSILSIDTSLHLFCLLCSGCGMFLAKSMQGADHINRAWGADIGCRMLLAESVQRGNHVDRSWAGFFCWSRNRYLFPM